jgi:hypothetical protein
MTGGIELTLLAGLRHFGTLTYRYVLRSVPVSYFQLLSVTVLAVSNRTVIRVRKC